MASLTRSCVLRQLICQNQRRFKNKALSSLSDNTQWSAAVCCFSSCGPSTSKTVHSLSSAAVLHQRRGLNVTPVKSNPDIESKAELKRSTGVENEIIGTSPNHTPAAADGSDDRKEEDDNAVGGESASSSNDVVVRKKSSSSNNHIRIADLEDELVNSIINSKQLERGMAQWKRFPVLNKFLGGFRPGEFTVLTGTTGVGKTTFLTEYTMDICLQGVPTLFCSFEMPNVQILKKILIQAFRIPFDQGEVEEEKIRNHVQALIREMPQFWLFREDRNKYEEQRDGGGRLKSGAEILFKMISDACEAEDIKHLVIDNLQYMLGAEDTSQFGSSGGDRFQRQDVFIRKLRQLTYQTGIHITLVVHPRKESSGGDDRGTRLTADSVYGGGRTTQEADNVLIVQKPIQKSKAVMASKYLWIVKNRYCGMVCEEDRLIMDFNVETKTHSIRDVQDVYPDEFSL